MTKVVAAGAFGSSLFAFILLLAIGLFLAGFEQTGARGAGVLLIACAAVAFGALLYLVRAPFGYFSGRLRRPLGVLLTFVAAAPIVALASAALSFTGLPLRTALPLMDWPVFAAGLALAIGGLCVLALGYRRLSEAAAPNGPNPRAGRPDAGEEDDEWRVTRA